MLKTFKEGSPVLKKVFAVVLSLLLLVACSPAKESTIGTSGAGEVSISSGTDTSSEPAAPSRQTIDVGDTITVEDFCELTVSSVTFSYDVLPKVIDIVYSHYPADEGQIYLDVSVSIKNLRKAALPCDEVGTFTLDYDDGYLYTAFPVVEDSSTGFTYANITSIDPLQTMEMRFLVDCPEEVSTSDAPLLLNVSIGGEEFSLDLRGPDGPTSNLTPIAE